MNQETSRTYFREAVLVTIFACFPVGAFAIKSALESRTKYKNGDYEGAILASKRAKIFCLLGVSIAGAIYISCLTAIGYLKFFYSPTYLTTNVDCNLISNSNSSTSSKNTKLVNLTSVENHKIEKVGDFKFDIQYLSNKINKKGDRIRIIVLSGNGKEKLASFKYDVNKFQTTQNQPSKDESFTGVAHVYHPNLKAELQYWCLAR